MFKIMPLTTYCSAVPCFMSSLLSIPTIKNYFKNKKLKKQLEEYKDFKAKYLKKIERIYQNNQNSSFTLLNEVIVTQPQSTSILTTSDSSWNLQDEINSLNNYLSDSSEPLLNEIIVTQPQSIINPYLTTSNSSFNDYLSNSLESLTSTDFNDYDNYNDDDSTRCLISSNRYIA